VKLKANELTGAALDWAVAKCIYEDDVSSTFGCLMTNATKGV
jgi:hypothetical protein